MKQKTHTKQNKHKTNKKQNKRKQASRKQIQHINKLEQKTKQTQTIQQQQNKHNTYTKT